ncbi:MAG: zinc ribbon domain-containing protein [Oscillatoriales cyanobacterium RM2_1_1]|nr:zinc ribbon domain-containing protein [Oscillatoriales cyanobacterium SM2_3_0]NJO44878.1 zinc ribbon domain-containing protein [Oscillatoriales cyanobacterium RM2_1_1]
MPTCPRCQQLVNPQAVNCPHCKLQLKAFGHPGIPLHRATGETSLCETCLYHHDDSCNFPQRPFARECTLYRDFQAVETEPLRTQQQFFRFPAGLPQTLAQTLKQNPVWFILLGLIATSVILSLL